MSTTGTVVDLPQPNFAIVEQSLHTAARELAKCPNIPTYHQVTEMVQLLRSMDARTERMQNGMLAKEACSPKMRGLTADANVLVATAEWQD